MKKEELIKEICSLASKVLGKEVLPDTRLLDEEGYVDSMNIVELLSELQEAYAISFYDDIELDYLESIRSLAEHVYKKVES